MDPIEEFRSLILSVARFAQNNCVHRSALQQLYRSSWQSRVRFLRSYENLQRHFRMVISLCTFREIARLFRMFFRENNLAIEVAGSFVVSRNMQYLGVLSGLMAEYNDIMSYRNASTSDWIIDETEPSEGEEDNPAVENLNDVAVAVVEEAMDEPDLIVDVEASDEIAGPPAVVISNNAEEVNLAVPVIVEEVVEYGTSESEISDSDDEMVNDNDDSLIARRGKPRGRLARSLMLNYNEPIEAALRAIWQMRPDGSGPLTAVGNPEAGSNSSEGSARTRSVVESERFDPNQPSTSRAADRSERSALLHQFYTRAAPANERAFHLLRDHNRLTYHEFDDQSIIDRRVNEPVEVLLPTAQVTSERSNNVRGTQVQSIPGDGYDDYEQVQGSRREAVAEEEPNNTVSYTLAGNSAPSCYTHGAENGRREVGPPPLVHTPLLSRSDSPRVFSDGIQIGGGGGNRTSSIPNTRSGSSSENLSGVRPAGERFIIATETGRYIHKYRVNARRLEIRLVRPAGRNPNPFVYLERAINDIQAHLISLAQGYDLMGATVSSDFFQHGSGGISLRAVDHFSSVNFYELVEKLCQSNQNFEIDDSFIINAFFVKLPVGAGGGGGFAFGLSRSKTASVDVIAQRAIVSIRNNDNLCLPRALVVGETHARMRSDVSSEMKKFWTKIRDGRKPLQLERARELTNAAGVTIPASGCGWYEIESFQQYYASMGMAIVVFEKETFGNGEALFFDGRSFMESREMPIEHVINIYFDEGNKHFHTILNLTAAAGCRYFCARCNRRYRYLDQHTCKSVCTACFSNPACNTEGATILKCHECVRSFYGQECFDNHRVQKISKGKNAKKQRSVCEFVKCCPKCSRRYHVHRGKHECGVNFCSTCSEKHPVNELCYMRPVTDSVAPKKNLYVFFDFETRQEDAYKNHATITIHVANLCIAHQACDACLDDNDLTRMCNTCGIREHIFRDDPVNQLLDLYVRRTTEFHKIILLSHNGGNFDMQLILEALAEKRKDLTPHVVLNGQKIMSMSVGRTKFIDSLNFLPMKLGKLVDTFDLPEGLKKSFFPHYFNVQANANYVGPLPGAHYYDPNSMSPSDRKEFFEWYDCEKEKDGLVFDFAQEIVKYCRMDVEILRRACLAFRKIIIDIAQFCPFERTCTMAAACNLIFRKKFLRKKTIGLMPAGGYHRADKQSQKAIEWLLQCEREIGREIRHAGRNREYWLPEGFKVDGFLPPLDSAVEGRGTVYEYEGCYTHGCPTCYHKNRDKRTAYGRPIEEVYENTMTKLGRMQELGYNVRYIWECEFDATLRQNPEIAQYVRNHPVAVQMTFNAREALYGGRVENFKPYFTIGAGQQIHYTDICSLYPWVCKHGRFPTGHPRVIIGDECRALTGGDYNNLARVDGLVKVTVLPPRQLLIPLLPTRINNRLMFPLCRSCCEESRTADCNHENQVDRELTGIYTADELRKAVSLGYRISKIHMIWQYDEMSQYNGVDGGLFAEYVNTFLKMKQESSGWPTWCTDEDKKNQFLREFEEKEGIRLDKNKIEKNPGLRAVSKFGANNFWGRLSMRNNLKQTEVVKTRAAFLKIVTCPEKEVVGIIAASDEVLYVNWEYRDECIRASPLTSLVHGIYVTSLGRLRLYEDLERLGDRVLYCDTDSCIFVHNTDNPDEYVPRIANELGAMVSELPDGAYIQTFASPAPKFYAYRGITAKGEIFEICKTKGIRLSYENSLKINFESIKLLVDSAFEEPDDNDADNNLDSFRRIKLKFRAIRRTKTHELVSRDETKTCSAVLRKRRYISATHSLPFGYKSSRG